MATDEIFEKLDQITFAITESNDQIKGMTATQEASQSAFDAIISAIEHSTEHDLEAMGAVLHALSLALTTLELAETSKRDISIANQKLKALESIQASLSSKIASTHINAEFPWIAEEFPAPQHAEPIPLKENPRHRISKIWAEYCIEQRGQWKTSTLNENNEAFRSFVEIIKDIDTVDLTIEEIRKYKREFIDYPLRRMVGRNEELSLSELREKNKQRLSSDTVSNRMTMISTFLSWAERNEYINSNPLAGLVIKRSQNRQNRDSFNRDDLQLIFSQPRFREGKYKNTWEFWLPLLALYTGSRIGELCQLRGTDLVSKNEVLYFDIHSSDGNDLKTANSTRKIPIHTVLRDLGIMDLAKTRGRDFLFDLTPINGKRSHYPSKQFSAFKQKLGFSAKKAFHSFRHTFRDALSEADVRDSLVIALLGHAEESITFSTYGSDASLEQLNRAIQKLDFSDCHHSITTK